MTGALRDYKREETNFKSHQKMYSFNLVKHDDASKCL